MLDSADKDAEHVDAVEEVLIAKEAFVVALCADALMLDDAVWHWDSLLKALHHAGPLLPSSELLAHTYGKLCLSPWRTVRPRPYRHASLWDAQRDVSALGSEMSLSSYASILPAFVARAAKPQLRRTLMEAAANFRWAMLLSKTSTAQEGADEEEGKRVVGEAVRLIREKMDEAQKKAAQTRLLYGAGEGDNNNNDGDDEVEDQAAAAAEGAEQLVDDEGMPIVKNVFTSLWKVHNDQAGVSSLVDYSTVMREQEVLAYTLRGLESAGAEVTRDIFDAHQRLVKQGADNVVRNPLDYVPHTLILWALSAAASAAAHNNDEGEQQEKGEGHRQQLMRQAKQLPGLETEALLNWHRRLWANTFDSTYFGVKSVTRARVPCQSGPARIYQGLKSAIAYSLLSSWSTAPVQLYTDKRSQIARVKSFFADEERLMFPSRALAELAAFVASFAQTVDSLVSSNAAAKSGDDNNRAQKQQQQQQQRRIEIIELIFAGKNATDVADELAAKSALKLRTAEERESLAREENQRTARHRGCDDRQQDNRGDRCT